MLTGREICARSETRRLAVTWSNSRVASASNSAADPSASQENVRKTWAAFSFSFAPSTVLGSRRAECVQAVAPFDPQRVQRPAGVLVFVVALDPEFSDLVDPLRGFWSGTAGTAQ